MSGYGFTTPSGYDDEDRLVAWERDDAAQDLSWVLSDVGDWDSYTENTVTENRTHNAVHELTAIDAGPLTYDAKGNLTADEAGIDYAWDADNMLSAADVPATPDRGIEGTHTYAYDALGRRVSKTVDDAVGMTTTTTVFVCLTQPIPYSPWAGQVLAEYTSGTAAGSPLRKYAYGEYIDEPLVLIDRTSAGSDEPLYYHRNQQYSVAALSDSGGSITERYHYTPYGETTILAANGTTVRTTSDVGNAYTYTGRRLDGESGLHYFRARYVLGVLGRFINRDPLTYVDGAILYLAYFAYHGVDPSGYDVLPGVLDPPGEIGPPGTRQWPNRITPSPSPSPAPKVVPPRVPWWRYLRRWPLFCYKKNDTPRKILKELTRREKPKKTCCRYRCPHGDVIYRKDKPGCSKSFKVRVPTPPGPAQWVPCELLWEFPC